MNLRSTLETAYKAVSDRIPGKKEERTDLDQKKQNIGKK